VIETTFHLGRYVPKLPAPTTQLVRYYVRVPVAEAHGDCTELQRLLAGSWASVRALHSCSSGRFSDPLEVILGEASACDSWAGKVG
jgi:hypothetical protein